MATIDLSGVHIPTTTPFGADGELDLAALRSNLRHWASLGVDGVVIGGSTGEAVFLDEAERRSVWQAAAAEVGDDVVVTAGTGAESTRSTIGLCRMAADAGAHATLVQPPAFYRGAMTPEALATHYRAVADASPIPVMLYQVPLKMSTLDWPTPLIAELAEHDNIVGIKDSRGKIDLVQEILDATNDDFQVLVGSGALLLDALELGAVGGILGVANFATEGCVAVRRAFAAGDGAAARTAQDGVTPLHNGIVAALGVPGVKAALDAIGLVGGAPRPPLHPLGDEGRAEVRRLLAEAGLV